MNSICKGWPICTINLVKERSPNFILETTFRTCNLLNMNKQKHVSGINNVSSDICWSTDAKTFWSIFLYHYAVILTVWLLSSWNKYGTVIPEAGTKHHTVAFNWVQKPFHNCQWGPTICHFVCWGTQKHETGLNRSLTVDALCLNESYLIQMSSRELKICFCYLCSSVLAPHIN